MLNKLALIVFLAFVAVASTAAPAMAQQGTSSRAATWANMGADPYAPDVATAIDRVEEALTSLQRTGLPPDVAAEFIRLVHANPNGDGDVYLDPDDVLGGMAWNPNGDVRGPVTVGAVPVFGLTGVYRSARARHWQLERNGVIYHLYLPLVCRNWAWARVQGPRVIAQSENCLTVRVAVHQGDVLTPAAFAGTTLARSSCWGYRQVGSSEWQIFSGCTNCIDWNALRQRTRLRESVLGQMTATATGYVYVQVPATMRGQYLGFSLQRNGMCSLGLVEPGDWRGDEFSIDESMWSWTGA